MDRPIIFSAPMVRALLDGRKTQTRRIAYGPWIAAPDMDSETQEHFDVLGHIFDVDDAGNVRAHAAPTPWRRTKPGDQLWVREAWKLAMSGQIKGGYGEVRRGVSFRADEATIWSSHVTRVHDPGRQFETGPMQFLARPWRPSIHMPRWASRLTLVVTDARVQRLQEISEEDALAEGIARCDFPYDDGESREAFARLWDHLHGECTWRENPWVVAITFTTHRHNIDSPEIKEAA